MAADLSPHQWTRPMTYFEGLWFETHGSFALLLCLTLRSKHGVIRQISAVNGIDSEIGVGLYELGHEIEIEAGLPSLCSPASLSIS